MLLVLYQVTELQDPDRALSMTTWGNAIAKVTPTFTALTHFDTVLCSQLAARKRNYDLLLASIEQYVPFRTVLAIRGLHFTTIAISLTKL